MADRRTVGLALDKLGRHLIDNFPSADRAERLDIYAGALRRFPDGLVRDAVERVLQRETFFPASGTLAETCEQLERERGVTRRTPTAEDTDAAQAMTRYEAVLGRAVCVFESEHAEEASVLRERVAKELAVPPGAFGEMVREARFKQLVAVKLGLLDFDTWRAAQ